MIGITHSDKMESIHVKCFLFNPHYHIDGATKEKLLWFTTRFHISVPYNMGYDVNFRSYLHPGFWRTIDNFKIVTTAIGRKSNYFKSKRNYNIFAGLMILLCQQIEVRVHVLKLLQNYFLAFKFSQGKCVLYTFPRSELVDRSNKLSFSRY